MRNGMAIPLAKECTYSYTMAYDILSSLLHTTAPDITLNEFLQFYAIRLKVDVDLSIYHLRDLKLSKFSRSAIEELLHMDTTNGRM